METSAACFGWLKDHRPRNARRYDVFELLMSALCTFFAAAIVALEGGFSAMA